MSAFCEDIRQFEKYPDGIIGKPRPDGAPLIDCLQWSHGHRGRFQFKSVQEFMDADSASEHALRVVLLPIAPMEGDKTEAKQFRTLFSHYSIPSAVPAERMRNVGFSFGTYKDRSNKSDGAWIHFLCRKIEIVRGVIQDLGYLRHGIEQGQKPDPSKMWIMCDFYLHVRPGSVGTSDRNSVTLLCFGAPDEILDRFENLRDLDQWQDILSEPYLLFDIVFDELHDIFDKIVWELSKAVNPEEKMALERAGRLAKQESNLSFQNLHNIQKNCIFLIEAAEASMITLDAMVSQLTNSLALPDLTLAAINALGYRKRSFQSTLLRLHSLEKRMSNVIQLSFNLVTQADSTILKSDSRAMKFIAFLTLVFLPATGVASVFSTPFFNIDWDSRDVEDKVLRTAESFWIFWAVVLPLTLVGLLLCFAWVNLPDGYKNSMKAHVGKLAKSRRMLRANTVGENDMAFKGRDLELGCR